MREGGIAADALAPSEESAGEPLISLDVWCIGFMNCAEFESSLKLVV